MNKETKKKFQEFQEKMSVASLEGDMNRARSVTVGTCFGGTTEVMMRGNSSYMWCALQPVEVIELIHQLAANVGCNVALKPRKDFASWRDWRVTEEDKIAYNGWPPFVNDMAPYNQLGASGMDPDIVKALEAGGQLTETGGGAGAQNGISNSAAGQNGANAFDMNAFLRSKENVVATEKPKDRRGVKRTTKVT